MLIDFHTHAPLGPRYDGRDDVCVVQSLMPGEAPDARANFITYGIHPMHPDAPRWVEEYTQAPEQCIGHFISDLQFLRAQHPSHPLLGIGECGWDNRCTHLSMDEQTQLFRLHDTVSQALMLPVILHVVRGWHLLLSERTRSSSMAWYVHGFRGKAPLLRQLLDAGIRVSISPFYDWSMLPPMGSFFLETDESTVDIEDLYNQVAERYSIEEKELEKQLLYCFNDI